MWELGTPRATPLNSRLLTTFEVTHAPDPARYAADRQIAELEGQLAALRKQLDR